MSAAPSVIHKLSDIVANQIAAGEVVERPSSIVKELIENSLDANSSWIEIEFNQGGKNYIRIEDNGTGMSPADALLSLERHATSKIQNAEDLNTLQSFGFRGEALPSIASVSELYLRTRLKGESSGTEIFINSGTLIHQKECSIPQGTRIEISQLFKCVPARLKFLKTDTTESTHIINTVRLFALAHPHIAFTLIQDGKKILDTPPSSNLQTRVEKILGSNYLEETNFLEVSSPHLYGYTLKPNRPGCINRQEIFIYINKRPVESQTIQHALTQAYRSYIPQGRHPKALLFLELPPHSLDVNVHPNKRQVRFKDDYLIQTQITGHILDFLRKHSELPSIHSPHSEFDSIQSGPDSVFEIQQRTTHKTVEPPPGQQRNNFSTQYHYPSSFNKQPPSSPHTTSLLPGPQPSIPTNNPSRPDWRFIEKLSGHYALFQTPKELIILHCRLAHQRIQYEKLLKLTPSQTVQQSLLIPIILTLNPSQSQSAQQYTTLLESLGFQYHSFGKSDYKISSIPNWLKPSDAQTFFLDLIDLLNQQGAPISSAPAHPLVLEKIAKLASQKAIKLDDTLTPTHIESLAQSLLACSQPLTCPMGRPTLQTIPFTQLDKKFLTQNTSSYIFD